MSTTQHVRVCPSCGMPEEKWRANNGQGFAAENGRTYCCQDCAEGKSCACGL
jgi:hypothetical protein